MQEASLTNKRRHLKDSSPIFQLTGLFSQTSKRLYSFVKNPKIDIESLEYSLVDFIISIATVFFIVALLKNLLPVYWVIDPIKLFNFHIFALLLTVNTFIFSSILLIFFFVLDKLKKIDNYNLVFYQGFRAYSIINLLIVILFIILVNKLMQNKLNDWSFIEGAFGIYCILIGLYLFFRLLINPISILLQTSFSKNISFTIAFISVLMAGFANEPVFKNYFINIIDKPEFCKQYIEINYMEDIVSMRKNKDCMIGTCIKGIESGFTTEFKR